MKYLTTAEFLRLAKYAEAAEFNRQVDPEWIETALAKDGKHLVIQVWPFHEKGERLLILCKSADRTVPAQKQPQVWLDVTSEAYADLPDAIEAINKGIREKHGKRLIDELEAL